MKTFLRISFFILLVNQICFAQWYQQSSGTTVNLNAVQFIDANEGFAVGDSGIILHTTNGGQDWIMQMRGTLENLNDIIFYDPSKGIIVGEAGTILRTTNAGMNWLQINAGVICPLWSVSFVDDHNGWVAGSFLGQYCSNGIVLKTTDSGNIWNIIDTLGYSYIHFIDDSIGWRIKMVLFADQQLQKTTDGGINWNTQAHYRMFRSPCFLNENIGWVSAMNGILKTIDGGVNWFLQDSTTWANAVFFIDQNNGWMIDYYKIKYSSNGGTSWSVQLDSFPHLLTECHFIDINNGWIVGENGTILHTSNGGVVPVELTSFTVESENQKVILRWTTTSELNNNGFEIQRRCTESEFASIGFVRGEGTTTKQKEYSYIDKDLVDGKYYYRLKQVDYNGTYEYSNVIEVDVRSLDEYTLENNFPNPFNPTTTIGYVLKEKTNAKIILLNAIGEEVAVLSDEEQEKGFHKIDFNASILSSGVYFYQLKAGSFIQTKKMLLLK